MPMADGIAFRHAAVQQAGEESALSVHAKQSKCRWCTVVGSEKGVVIGVLVDQSREIRTWDTAIATRYGLGAHGRHIGRVARRVVVSKRRLIPLFQARKQRFKGWLDIANHAQVNWMSAPKMCRVDINLNDLRIRWIELQPGEIRAQQEKSVTLHDRVVARLCSDDSGHADVV